MKLLKYVLLIVLCLCCMLLLTGCTKNETTEVENTTVADTTEEEEPVGNTSEMTDEELARHLNITYKGGLYAKDEKCDLNIAFFDSSDTDIVIVTVGEDLYYGPYTTEEKTLKDGTKYDAITVEGKTFGYKIKEDSTGVVVDEEGNSYEGKTLDVSAAMDMVRRTV